MAFCPFSKCTEACGPVMHVLIFMSVFLHLLVSNRFWHFTHFRNAQKHVARLYIFLVFVSVFGIWPIFEMHRGMWPGYTCSRFPEHFFAFVGFKSFLAFYPFSKCTKACDPVIHFTRFKSVFGIWPIFEIHRGMWSGHIFSRFMRDLTKVIKVNFRSVVQLK